MWSEMKRDGRIRLLDVVLVLATMAVFSASVCAAKTTIYLATYHMGALTMENWRNMADRFSESNPDIEVEVRIYPGSEYNEKLMTQIAAGVPPDLMQTWA